MGALDLEDLSLQEHLDCVRVPQARTADEIAGLQVEMDRTDAVTVSALMLRAVIENVGQRLLVRGDGFRRGYAPVFAGWIIAEEDKVRHTCT